MLLARVRAGGQGRDPGALAARPQRRARPHRAADTARAYAEQKPWWEPGTEHGYHALSFGWLVGELIRRIGGRSVGTYFRDENAGPLGADLWIGTPAELDPRIAEIEAEMPKPGDPLLAAMLANAKPYTLKAF